MTSAERGAAPTPAPNLWHAIGYGEGGADDRIVRNDQEMVDFLWEECGPDHTGDEAKTRAFWSAFLADEDNWRRLDDVDRWWCTIDIGETGHVAFIRLLSAAAPICNSHASLQSQNEALLAGLASLVELYAMPGESNVDRFERVAEIFHRETGCYAPGKDVAAAAGDSMEIEERRERWEAWYAERAAKARALLSSAGKDAKDMKGGAA